MSSTAFSAVRPHDEWLSQGDVFSSVIIVRAGVSQALATQGIERGPAVLVSHGCAIDKMNRAGKSVLEYLSLLPLQDVAKLARDVAGNLRKSGTEMQLTPYAVLYVGMVDGIGECYAPLNQVYTIPAVFLRPELRAFSAEQTGGNPESRLVPTMGDHRIGCLTEAMIDLLHRKWIAHWTQKTVTE